MGTGRKDKEAETISRASGRMRLLSRRMLRKETSKPPFGVNKGNPLLYLNKGWVISAVLSLPNAAPL